MRDNVAPVKTLISFVERVILSEAVVIELKDNEVKSKTWLEIKATQS